ncbi:DUF1439 domain-containing protein [Marinomonas algarum]|uniref:DUF1439 domain-containing protein n=1 Tax=Marinomonas algarum TaxID=2883105 RepID=A0A9X1ILL1_9GAMM|nr:DUF1439 domain-containing protein [Marinomonas algarum]MCB5161490.1 DUF1439 domain-containing protein [Marinomonas algarum]
MHTTRYLTLLALLVSSLLTAGCNSFRVSEEEVNQEVAKQIAQQGKQSIQLEMDSQALNLDLVVTQAKIDFTERDGGLVMVDLQSDLTGTLKAFGQDISLTTKVNPSFESGIRLEEDRLYLVAPKILKIDVEGASFSDKMLRSTLGELHGEFEKALVAYFDEHPVYVLNHSTFEKTTAAMVKDIIIHEDGLELAVF